MKNTHWMVRLLQIVTGLFVLCGCLLVLVYTPFYSKMIVKGLNQFVSLELNEVAAQSQKMAALSEHENLEPGSDLWIARQAYLKVMEQDIQQNNSANLMLIQARYKALQQVIEEYQREQQDQKQSKVRPLKCRYCPHRKMQNQPIRQPMSGNCWSGTVVKIRNALSNIWSF